MTRSRCTCCLQPVEGPVDRVSPCCADAISSDADELRALCLRDVEQDAADLGRLAADHPAVPGMRDRLAQRNAVLAELGRSHSDGGRRGRGRDAS